MNDNPFADDWRDCLKSHYIDVVQRDDKVAYRTLSNLLHRFGFSEAELKQLYLQATLRAEDLPADFMPDVAQLESLLEQAAQPHPAECSCPACMERPLLEKLHDADGQLIPAEVRDYEQIAAEIIAEMSEDAPPPPPPPDAPKQRSMF